MRKIDFSDMALNKEEINMLKDLNRSPATRINDVKRIAPRLEHLGLIEKFFFTMTGPAENTLEDDNQGVRITDLGKDYLQYWKNNKQCIKRQFRHDWTLTIFSSIAGALLSRPIWSIIDWIIQLAKTLM